MNPRKICANEPNRGRSARVSDPAGMPRPFGAGLRPRRHADRRSQSSGQIARTNPILPSLECAERTHRASCDRSREVWSFCYTEAAPFFHERTQFCDPWETCGRACGGVGDPRRAWVLRERSQFAVGRFRSQRFRAFARGLRSIHRRLSQRRLAGPENFMDDKGCMNCER